jgi:superfamily II DNA/RNA helicase
MPNYSKPATGRSASKTTAAPARGGEKAGSRSKTHRGYKPEADGAAPKKRWTSDDRAARTGDRPARGNDRTSDRGAAASARGDRRPEWAPREQSRFADRAPRKPWERNAADNRNANEGRNASEGRGASERPAYGDRPARGERPAYNNDRPSYNDRGDRPARTERPSYGDRPARGDRPSHNDRGDRPSYNDRAPRTDRPSYNDRAPRTERPAYNDRAERPSYGDRPARGERPAYNDRPARTERPSYGDRPARGDRPAYNDRAANDRAPRRDYDDRAPRRDFDDRAPRRDSNFYPSKNNTPFVEDVVLERLEAQVITAKDIDGVSFGDLGLGSNIVRQLATMGADAPFPIQAATIPDVLSGKDVLGRGKTGSGKTIAFGAPLVERLMENEGGKNRKMGRMPRALILAPTRELAQQIDNTVQPIARAVGLFTTTIVGGVPQHRQVGALQRGVDIVIATPGRVEDLIEQGRLDLSNVMITVLDEADHMCDLGFLEPVQRILRETSVGGQKLLFSATLDKGVATLVNEFLVEPAVHEVSGEDQASSTIDHRMFLIEQRDKREIIEKLASGEGKTLVFTRTRAFAEEMSDYLEDAGIRATSLHGDLNQSRRTRNLQLLTSGRVKVLVATDVAARGIHVDDISLVIQADAPEDYKTYLHRSGRTGRAGKQGTVVTLVPRNRRRKMDDLLGRAEIEVKAEFVAPGDAVIADLAAL